MILLQSNILNYYNKENYNGNEYLHHFLLLIFPYQHQQFPNS